MRSSLPRLLALSGILAFTACEQDGCDCSGGSAAGNGSGIGSGEASGAVPKSGEGSAATAPAKTMKIASGFDPSRLGNEVLPEDWAEQALTVYASDCAAGDPNACVLEANAYHDGTGAKQDWNKARELLRSSKPVLLIGSLMCTTFSLWQRLNQARAKNPDAVCEA